MKSNPEHILFGPSGCLSREGLALFARGKLSAQELLEVKTHLQSCEFCALAVEGMDMITPEEFEGDLKSIFAALEEGDVITSEEELIPEFAEGFEGPRFPRLSDAEMKQFRETLLEKAAEHQEIINLSETKKPFFKRYRLELIAAVVLLLIVVGARLIFIGISSEKQTLELTQAPLALEETDKMEVMPQEITESETLAKNELDMRTIPPEPPAVSEMLSVVADDVEVDDNLVIDIVAPEEEASEADLLQRAATDGKEGLLKPDQNTSAKAVAEEMELMEIRKENKVSGSVVQTNDASEEEVSEAEVFVVVEQSPEFPGGDAARLKFLQENLVYPVKAETAGIQGTVYITFVVENDGNIADARVLRGIGGGCDEEALRVIRLMPKWKPGKQRGKPVRVRMNLPVSFSLAGKSK
ncbi:MAG: energy transducer TonB [Lentimicrobium sp.]|jgi:TonB family protein|nr:energy transducer TonB [Lentimicrobium sp.]